MIVAFNQFAFVERTYVNGIGQSNLQSKGETLKEHLSPLKTPLRDDQKGKEDTHKGGLTPPLFVL